MSETLSIDQTESLILEGLDSKDPIKSDWNGREVSTISVSGDDKIIQLFEKAQEELAETTEKLNSAKQILDKQESDVQKAQKKYNKRKDDDDKAWGWTRKKTERKLEKAEHNLEQVEQVRNEQRKLVNNLERKKEALEASNRSLKQSLGSERYEFIKNLNPSIDPLQRDVKDFLQIDRIINEIKEQLKIKTDEFTVAHNELIQKTAGVANANKKHEEKFKKYEEASKFGKASKERKKWKCAEQNLTRARMECEIAQNKVNSLKPRVDDLKNQFNFLEKEINNHLEVEKESKARIKELENIKQNRIPIDNLIPDSLD